MDDEIVLPPGTGKLVWLYDLGVRFMVSGAQTDGRFALVEHPIRPKALAAPLHTHADEDEISYVLEGEVGMQIGDRVLRAGPGTLVFKPRGVPHAFWNPGDAPARMLELISPAGLERYFEEAAELYAGGPRDAERARSRPRRPQVTASSPRAGPTRMSSVASTGDSSTVIQRVSGLSGLVIVCHATSFIPGTACTV
jgi:quercetin dioxygenase-like cupin family protein